MAGGTNKDIAKMLKQAQALGCTVERRRNGHWKVSRAGYGTVTVTNTPSDARSILNDRAELRRYLALNI